MAKSTASTVGTIPDFFSSLKKVAPICPMFSFLYSEHENSSKYQTSSLKVVGIQQRG